MSKSLDKCSGAAVFARRGNKKNYQHVTSYTVTKFQ